MGAISCGFIRINPKQSYGIVPRLLNSDYQDSSKAFANRTSHLFLLDLLMGSMHTLHSSDVKNLDVDGCGWMKLDDVGCGWISTSIHLHLLIYTLLAFLVVQRACISF